jgi:hypothetical protein
MNTAAVFLAVLGPFLIHWIFKRLESPVEVDGSNEVLATEPRVPVPHRFHAA